MEGKFTINLKIAGRAFPVEIDRSDEELCRKAAKMVGSVSDDYTKNFREIYKMDFLEPEDIFRITAFHFALENLKLKTAKRE